ncbi:hypothetical protein [Roseovarius salis]|uniref:hypothetical protein n=1 Tax=Roseovarius salis TaxID=3376063 RepID=UPI0037C5AF2E
MEILQRDEAVPASYPAIPSGLSMAAMMLNASALWARIETHTAHRFTTREVVWTVEGPGEFKPDLQPATITAREVWDGVAWITANLSGGPLGGVLLAGAGPYRITADVGGGDVPAPVSEAYRRLAEYLAEDGNPAGASSYSYRLGDVEETTQRSPAHVARALQNSGAADLLRTFRRA